MARRAAAILFGFAIVAATLLFSESPATGQSTASPKAATPASIAEAEESLSVELELSLLAASELGGLNTNGLELWLERLTLGAGDRFERQAPGDELLLVEVGSVAVQFGSNTTTLNAGADIGIPAGGTYAIESDGPATLLRVSLYPTPLNSTSAASPVSGPAPELLASGRAGRLVSRRGTLFIARVALPTASRTGDQSLSGPIALLVEQGSIVVHDRTMPNVVIDTGEAVFLPGYTRFSAENGGSSEAVVLVAGLLAPTGGAAVGPTSTPTQIPTMTPSPTKGPDLLATAQAEQTRLAGDLTIQITREDSLGKTVIALQTEIAGAKSEKATIVASADEEQEAAGAEITALEATQSALSSAIADSAAAQENLAATVTALADEVESAELTVTAISDDANTSADASSQEIVSLEATIEAMATAAAKESAAQATTAAKLSTAEAELGSLSDDVAAAESTIESQATANAILEETAEAQSSAIANAESTMESQSDAIATAVAEADIAASQIAGAQATIESQAGELATAGTDAGIAASAIANAEATIESQTGELATAAADADTVASQIAGAQATIESQAGELATTAAETDIAASQIAGARATITVQADAAESAAAEAAGALAAAEATAEAYASELSASAATATADAAAADEAANAGASAIAGLNATIARQATAASDSESLLATRASEALSAEATIVALSTELASNTDVAISSLNPAYVDLTIHVDLDAVLAGDETALQAASEAVEGVMEPYAGCRGGVVLTFGHGVLIGQGTVLAAAINEIIRAEHPLIFGGAAFDAFGDLSPELGQVDIRIYFFTGCDAAEA